MKDHILLNALRKHAQKEFIKYKLGLYDFFVLFFKIVRELYIYEPWRAAGGISLWLNDEILFWDLPFLSIYFYNFKKERKRWGV